MAQDPENAEILKAHLQKYLEKLICPICESTAWEVGGPMAEVGYSGPIGYFAPSANIGELFPLGFMICSTCFYVRHFAWNRILLDLQAKKNG